MTITPEQLRDAIQAQGNKEDLADFVVAYNAMVAGKNAYRDRPGTATRADMQATRDEYQDTLARLTPKYFPEAAPPAPEGERFPNRKQAWDWLRAQGYKVSKEKLYKDCDAGFPAVHRDGSVSRFQVLQYAQQLDVERRASPVDLSSAREEAETKKAIADAKKAEIQAEELQRTLDRKWIERTEADLQTCTWAALVRDTIAHRIASALPSLIHSTGGDLSRMPEAQALVDQAIADACNDIANSGEVFAEIEDAPDEVSA